ncbi:MAG: glycoside hydrolase family 95 protein [Tannerellaceae bacterium]|jgi:alpha-L-fucosidase 2|nr:glycoside hydrolase family 95 protein [Tannerellaceae bacterium]
MKNKIYGYFISTICLLAIFDAVVYAAATKPKEDLKIWYSQPASGWLESLPLGNGRIGALVFGGVSEERIILNEATLYSRESPIFDTLPDLTRHIDILTRMIRNGEYADADEYATKHVTGPAVPCYQPLGDLIFRFTGQDDFTAYTRELDLSSAVAKVSYKVGKTTFTREIFTSHPDNILIVRLKSDGGENLNFKILMESVHPTSHLTTGKRELVFTGQLPGIALRRTFEWVEEWGQQWKYPDIWDKEGKRRPEVNAFRQTPQSEETYPVLYNGKGIKFETRVRLLHCDGQVSADEDGLIVKKARDVVVAVAVASSFNGFEKDPVTEGLDVGRLNQTVLSGVTGKSYNRLIRDHTADYRNLFDRVSLQIPNQPSKTNQTTEQRKTNYSLVSDPSFAALYFQYGRYLLISSSREGGQPANLQGLWNVDVIPPWGSAYTTNINLQMNYWAAESTHLSECHEPLFQFLKEISASGKRVAGDMYKLPGWVLHHNTSVWRGAHPVDWFGTISFWPMGGGWLCRHLWQHYLYTKDLLFLKETAYPIMKGAAQFYNSWLIDDGNRRLVTPVSNSPENAFIYIDEYGRQKSAGMTMAGTLDLAIIRELFQNTIDAEKILQTDIDFSLVLESKLAKLYPYQIGKRGQFLEYFKEFIESPPRHNTSPYYPLYPGNQFTLEKNPELTQAVKTLILNRTASRPGGGGWVAAWYAALWARLGEGERTLPYIEGLVNRTHLNLFSGGGSVFQIDANLGYTAAVAEMLLQSHSGEIKLLPALPGAWPSGTVNGLCAEGGFEVSLSWQDMNLTGATIKSKTGNRAIIRYGGKSVEMEMKPNETIRLDAGLKPVK